MSSVTPAHIPWRIRIFASTWVAYAGFYLCRKNFAVAKPALMDCFGYDTSQLSIIWTGYLFMYMVGQFVNGFLGDVKGPRFMVGLGLIASASMNILAGFGETIGIFAILMGINGFAQATGWPGLVKCMGNWFRIFERGRVMGWWGTCYAVGGLIASIYASFLYGRYNDYLIATQGEDAALVQSWKIIFWGPALTLLVIAAAFIILVRNRGRDAGLNDIDEFEGLGEVAEVEEISAASVKLTAEEEKALDREARWEVFRSRTVWIYCAAYFCMKFIRYGMLSWLPTYAHDNLGYDIESSGYLSVGFEFAAPLGVLFCGYMSDKAFGARRTPICVLSLSVLIFACLLIVQVASLGMIPYFLALCLIGFSIYGPDAIMSGPAAQDFGSARAAAMCAGLINGVGSAGACLQEPIIGWLVKEGNFEHGWEILFYLCAFLALVATIVISFTWNDRPKAHHAHSAALNNRK